MRNDIRYEVLAVDLDDRFLVAYFKEGKVKVEMKTINEIGFIHAIHTRNGAFICDDCHDADINTESMKKVLYVLKDKLYLKVKGSVVCSIERLPDKDNPLDSSVGVSIRFRSYECSYSEYLANYIVCNSGVSNASLNGLRKESGLPEIPDNEELLVKYSKTLNGEISGTSEVEISDTELTVNIDTITNTVMKFYVNKYL